ncbi:10927_t:CDS:1, partial [Funneliformis geosporum]
VISVPPLPIVLVSSPILVLVSPPPFYHNSSSSTSPYCSYSRWPVPMDLDPPVIFVDPLYSPT